MKQRGNRYCSACQTQLQKRGKTAAGTQRWLCLKCHQSSIRVRPDLARALQLERFVTWLLSKQSQAELDISDRTWRDQTEWCWDVVPKPTLTNEFHPIILIDGIKVGALVCLIARTPEAVLAWRWVAWESSFTWALLIERMIAPTVVVCDGQKGSLLALTRCWPTTIIQRCLFHVWQNIRAKLTLNPQTNAGQELLQLTRALWSITTNEQAMVWQQRLQDWYQRYGSFIRERTYSATHTRRWQHTHRGVRSAYRQLEKLVRLNQLFVYLNKTLTPEPIPRTTNYVEGGINSQLRAKLKDHRGMNQLHQQRLVEWYLYSRMQGQKPPRNCL